MAPSIPFLALHGGAHVGVDSNVPVHLDTDLDRHCRTARLTRRSQVDSVKRPNTFHADRAHHQKGVNRAELSRNRAGAWRSWSLTAVVAQHVSTSIQGVGGTPGSCKAVTQSQCSRALGGLLSHEPSWSTKSMQYELWTGAQQSRQGHIGATALQRPVLLAAIGRPGT